MIPTLFMVRIWSLRGGSYGDKLILETLPLLSCILHRFVAVLQLSSHTECTCSSSLAHFLEKAPAIFLRFHIHIPNHIGLFSCCNSLSQLMTHSRTCNPPDVVHRPPLKLASGEHSGRKKMWLVTTCTLSLCLSIPLNLNLMLSHPFPSFLI